MNNKTSVNRIKELWILIWTFIKVGVTTFGGGYAMLPILQREVVDNKGWATEEELLDYYAIGQCTPGIISINTATFVGNKIKGTVGGILATVGFCLPSIVIICVIAAFISNFADLQVVKDAFGGIRVCVAVLIINAVVKLFRTSVRDMCTFIIFVCILLVMLLLNISPVLAILAAGVAGCTIKGLGEAKE